MQVIKREISVGNTASRELAVGPVEAERLAAVASRSIGKAGSCKRRRLPSGHWLSRARASTKRLSDPAGSFRTDRPSSDVPVSRAAPLWRWVKPGMTLNRHVLVRESINAVSSKAFNPASTLVEWHHAPRGLKVGRYLIVARTRSMETPRRLVRSLFGKAGFGDHVYVFKGQILRHPIGGHSRPQLNRQSVASITCHVFRRNDAGRCANIADMGALSAAISCCQSRLSNGTGWHLSRASLPPGLQRSARPTSGWSS